MRFSTTQLATIATALFSITSTASAASVKRDTCDTVVSHATDSAAVLISQYSTEKGLWGPTDGDELNGGTWWTSAKMLDMLLHLQRYVPDQKDKVMEVVENSFKEAQRYNLEFQNNQDGLDQLENNPTPAVNGSFWNDFYDDEGWWALTWITAFDETGDERYMDASKNIFKDMTTGWDQTDCGGLLWGKNTTYVNAISNELFISAAASLANRVDGGQGDEYADWAVKAWDWFKKSNMWNDKGTINDGLLDNCENNNDVVWSYNVGVILGGLVELAKLKDDNSYINKAHDIAAAAIDELSTDGILHDDCEPNCGDGSLNAQFKGIFIRNLSILNQASPKDEYTKFINDNADSIWNKDRNDDGMHGEVWSGPIAYPTVSAHSSALECLIESVLSSKCTT